MKSVAQFCEAYWIKLTARLLFLWNKAYKWHRDTDALSLSKFSSSSLPYKRRLDAVWVESEFSRSNKGVNIYFRRSTRANYCVSFNKRWLAAAEELRGGKCFSFQPSTDAVQSPKVNLSEEWKGFAHFHFQTILKKTFFKGKIQKKIYTYIYLFCIFAFSKK